MIWETIKDALLDIVFPASERAQRVASGKDEPLPFSAGERKVGNRIVTILSSYDEPRVRDAICALKFERDARSLALLAEMLNDFFVEHCADEALFGGRVVCVPIPLGKKRLAERGLNQAEAVIRATDIVRSGRLTVAPALVRTRETKMQSTLPRAERIQNVCDAFGVVPAYAPTLHGITILLIDDVTTTGATLAEAAKVLENAGARVQLIALAG